MKTKETRGITIISLVVTIVVLLILAGVSASLVIGNNNLFDKAKSTQKVQTIAGIKEALELEKADIQVENKTVNLENYLEQISTGKKNYDLSSTEKIDNKNAYIIINDQYKSKKISSEDYFKIKENQLKTVRTPFLPAVKISQAAPEYKNAEKATRLNRTAAAIIAALFAGIFSSISFMFGARAGELIRSKRGQIAGWSIGCIGTLATIFPSYKCYKTVANDLITHKQRELIIQNFNKTIKKEIAEFKIEKSLPVK